MAKHCLEQAETLYNASVKENRRLKGRPPLLSSASVPSVPVPSPTLPGRGSPVASGCGRGTGRGGGGGPLRSNSFVSIFHSTLPSTVMFVIYKRMLFILN